MAGFQHDFPVIDNGKVVGVLTRSALLRAVAQGRSGATVGDVKAETSLRRAASPNDMLDAALTRLQQCGVSNAARAA